MTAMNGEWRVYGNVNAAQTSSPGWSLEAPPWREFFPMPEDERFAAEDPREGFPAGFFYLANEKVIDTVNVALRLRRPILVTGAPGTGKTTLAYSIAHELGLGPVLPWLITSRSTLREGLYEYDVLARVNDMNLADRAAARAAASGRETDRTDASRRTDDASDIGRYITLGPLGDALLPRRRPRVLLIDEIDKSDIDLPGDLLHVFERGWYEIPELVREREQVVKVRRADAPDVCVYGGRVRCHEFPLIVLTSNEEREFPPAFLRRCLHIQLEPPTTSELTEIARRKLSAEPDAAAEKLIRKFVAQRDQERRILATDQLLNALYLRLSGKGLGDDDFRKLQEIVLTSLSEPSGD